jgi:hypothetical protein
MSDIFLPIHWKNICNIVKEVALKDIFPHIKKNRVKSVILSDLFETKSSEYFNSIGIKTFCCETDMDPDLTFLDTNEVCEIKVTSSQKQEWMGGKLSKRSAEYALISWEHIKAHSTLFGEQPEDIKFSVINVYIDQSEWNTLGENYYGTKITSKTLEGKKIKILV